MPQSMNKQIVMESKMTPAGKGSARGAIWRLGQHNRRRVIKLNEVQESQLKVFTKTMDRWKRNTEFRTTCSISNVQVSARELRSKKMAINNTSLENNVKPHVKFEQEREKFRNFVEHFYQSNVKKETKAPQLNKKGAFLMRTPLTGNSVVKNNSNTGNKSRLPVPDRVVLKSGKAIRWFHSKD